MKKIVVVPALLGAMAIGGILTLSTDLIGSADNSDIITMAEAEKKALEAVKGKVVEIEKEKEGTKIYYEVEIETKDAEYELKIDALTGEIVRKAKGQLVPNTITKDSSKENQSNQKEVVNTSNNVQQVSVNHHANANSQKETVKSEPITSTQKESTNVQRNDVQKEVRSQQSSTPQVKAPVPANTSNNTGMISRDEAKRIALSTVQGKVLEFEIEREKEASRLYYEVEIETRDAEYDIKIDALTGVIVKNTKEFDDDDDDWDDDWDDDDDDDDDDEWDD